MNMAKKYREETGMEWPEPLKTFDDLKDGCPWGYISEGVRWCNANSHLGIHTNDCREDNCAVIYWLRKLGETK